MFLLSGNTNTSGDVVRFENLRIWAERGLIHIEHTKTHEYKVVSVHEMLSRMNSLQEMLINSKPSQRQGHSEDQFDNVWFSENQRMLECMVEIVRKAKNQGMPSDASARRDLVRRRPKTVLVPGCHSAM